MRIGIDGRLWFETGVGRYIRNLVRELARIDGKNTYILFLSKKGFDTVAVPNERWQKRVADVRWHTVKEQIVLPFIFAREHLDVLHVPYFSIPVLYPGVFVETVHDLTHLHVRTGRATTLPSWIYTIKRCAYSLIFSFGIHHAKKIFAVSETTKKDILSNFKINEKNIIVTYEGVEKFVGNGDTLQPISGKYLLYVGNAYPHKNLTRLIDAFVLLKKEELYEDLKLVFVGKDDHFTRHLKEYARTAGCFSSLVFFGEATEVQLQGLYTHARAFVFPSLFEGFGLPGIEAQSFGCPLVCSDISIFHEVMGKTATYFNPYDVEDIKRSIKKTLGTSKKPSPFIDVRFQWDEMAEKTLQAYEDSIRV